MSFGETKIEFEELSLGACRVDGADLVIDARFTGRATIEFSRDAGWAIGDIEIAVFRARLAGPGQFETDYLSAAKLSPAIRDAIAAALEAEERDRIQDAVTREFEGMGYVQRTDWDNGDRYFTKGRAA